MGKAARTKTPARKMQKALRRTPPAFFDLLQWLQDNGHASTKPEAKEVVTAGRVVVGSHPVGYVEIEFEKGGQPLGAKGKPLGPERDKEQEKVRVVAQHVPVEYKDQIIVKEAKNEKTQKTEAVVA